VKKLAAASARGRAAGRKIEGRKGFAEMAIAAAMLGDKCIVVSAGLSDW
jgi:hypothetical protein